MAERAVLLVSLLCIGLFAENDRLNDAMKTTIGSKDVACVFVDCNSGEIITPDSAVINVRYTPCSTFKIWNTLIGAECRIVKSADDPFYTWDSIPRFLPAWNKNLTLKEAFQVSCVPAFQALARKIGNERMGKWISILNYGDKDISSGIDDFWLPREGKKSITISPLEQAHLIRNLVKGELPFNQKAQSILKEIMVIAATSKGICYGKTGSGANLNGHEKQSIGWFVGYVTGGKRTYSFACLVKGEQVSGKDAKGIIEAVLRKSGL